LKKYIIKKSGKKGRGVFANKNIKKGDKIIHCNYTKKKKIIREKDIQKLPKDEQNHLDSVGRGKWVVDYSPISIANHSCNPNCFIKYKNRKIKDLVAIRDIKKGEEFTYDYAVDADTDVNWKMKCYCKSKNCRKIIYSNYFKLPKKLQKGLWKHVPQWKKRRLNLLK
jgi:SET domain-containing protein